MKRVQRKRTKGWKMPPNTVYVGRPTKWGNPYRPMAEDSLAAEHAVAAYRHWLNTQLQYDSHFLDPLKGKDLACWCREGAPCHADIIIEAMKEIIPCRS